METNFEYDEADESKGAFTAPLEWWSKHFREQQQLLTKQLAEKRAREKYGEEILNTITKKIKRGERKKQKQQFIENINDSEFINRVMAKRNRFNVKHCR